jgi:plastocyanin
MNPRALNKEIVSEFYMTAGKLAIILGILIMGSFGLGVKSLNPSSAQATTTDAKLVHAGGGNATIVSVEFIPKSVEIKVGDSIIWDNPTAVAEPHSVTFMKEGKYFAEFVAPFHVPNSTEFQPPDPNSNAQALIAPPQPDETIKTVIGINARAFMPVVIDTTAKNVTFLPINSDYRTDGTESYINSGWLWPEGHAPEGSPPISNFTVTFGKAGTYPYICNVHPWMTGIVEVSN